MTKIYFIRHAQSDYSVRNSRVRPLTEKGRTDCHLVTDFLSDFNYTLSDGESLAEVQKRNIAALHKLLIKYKGKSIAIATHGVALSTIINYYDNKYVFADFLAMADITPWVVKMIFDGNSCVEIEKIDLFA